MPSSGQISKIHVESSDFVGNLTAECSLEITVINKEIMFATSTALSAELNMARQLMLIGCKIMFYRKKLCEFKCVYHKDGKW